MTDPLDDPLDELPSDEYENVPQVTYFQLSSSRYESTLSPRLTDSVIILMAFYNIVQRLIFLDGYRYMNL